MERVVGVGQWTGACLALLINAVYLFFVVSQYRFRDFLLGILILVAVGFVLAVAAMLLMRAFYILVVIALVLGWIIHLKFSK